MAYLIQNKKTKQILASYGGFITWVGQEDYSYFKVFSNQTIAINYRINLLSYHLFKDKKEANKKARKLFRIVEVPKYWCRYRRFYKIDAVELINNLRTAYYESKKIFSLHGIDLYPADIRYLSFMRSGLECRICGVIGQYFWMEINRKATPKEKAFGYHINLYGIDDYGREIMMTRDHKFPKSRGGADTLQNSQTLCERCNQKKGNKIKFDEEYDPVIVLPI